jgi:hypothetical protein
MDTEEEAGTSMYRETLIYAEPFLVWRHTNLECGYDSYIRQVHAYGKCVPEPSQLLIYTLRKEI